MKIEEKLKNHLLDTTAVLTASNPLFAFSENIIFKMSDKLSFNNRINGSLMFYLGAGYLFSEGRERYYKLFNIKKDSKYRGLHDFIWGSIFGGVLNIAITSTNTTSLEEITRGAVAGLVTGGITGIPSGYFIELFRGLVKGDNSLVLSPKINGYSSKVKNIIATGLVLASIGTVAGIYALS